MWTSRKREWERIDSLERARYFVGLDAIATPCRVHALTVEIITKDGQGAVFSHPREVVADPALSLSKKRAILLSWASDASAIASCPALRAPDGLMAPVSIDEILEALCALDGNGRAIRQPASRCGCGRPSAGQGSDLRN